MKCPTCGEQDPLNFWRDKSRKSGYQAQCKACCRAKATKYLASHRTQVRARWRAWYYRQKDKTP